LAARKQRRLRKRVAVAIAVLLLIPAFFGLYLYCCVIPKHAVTSLRNGYVETSFEDGQVRYAFVPAMPDDWAPLETVSNDARSAIMVAEDWRFYRHPGFDVVEIYYALTDAVRERKRPRGASTIPQQVAKNLFLSSEYSVWRKIKEVAIAVYSVRALPKDKILEVYLNTIEYGEGLYGIANASKYYFGKEPSELTLKEGAFLAMLLPNPKLYSQSYHDNALTPRASETISRILETMQLLEYLSEEEYEHQLDASLTFRQRHDAVAP